MTAPWSLWRTLIHAQMIDPLDRAFVQAWGIAPPGDFPFCSPPDAPKKGSESLALLLVYLLKASRGGHTCVLWRDEKWLPELERWWPVKNLGLPNTDQIMKPFLSDWKEIAWGQRSSPWVAASIEEADTRVLPIVADRGRLYLQRGFHLELSLATSFAGLMHAVAPVGVDAQSVQRHLDRHTRSLRLTPEQAKAIENALGRHRLSCIAGGPGTGKTYTAGHLLETYFSSALPNQLPLCALAAPTGRAAANLKRALFKIFHPPIEPFTGTLHTLLKVSKRTQTPQYDLHHPLPHDLLIVDEASMFDANLMQALIRALKPEARLILMGDPSQLPPIEMGHAFADLLDHLDRSLPEQVARLTICKRTEIQAILALADCVRRGDVEGVLKQFQQGESTIWKVLETEEQWEHARFALRKRLLKGAPIGDPKGALTHFSQMKCLTPLTVGPWGTDQLNAEIGEELSKRKGHETFAPIMLRSNHHRLDLYNGDQGVVAYRAMENKAFNAKRDRNDQAYFFLENQEMRSVPLSLISDSELAWWISTHKAQGSEFDEVTIVIPPGIQHMSKALLYTAITRAKKRVNILSSKEGLIASLAQGDERISGFSERLVRLSK